MAKSEEPDRRWLSTEQAAEFIGVGPGTLAAWRTSGTGPAFFKAGRRVRYRSDILDAWMSERAFASTAEARRAGVI